MGWIRQFELDITASGPVMQRDKSSQSTCIECIYFRQIKHDNARILFGDDSILECTNLCATNNPSAASHDRDVSRFLGMNAKHGCFLDHSYVNRRPEVPEVTIAGENWPAKSPPLL